MILIFVTNIKTKMLYAVDTLDGFGDRIYSNVRQTRIYVIQCAAAFFSKKSSVDFTKVLGQSRGGQKHTSPPLWRGMYYKQIRETLIVMLYEPMKDIMNRVSSVLPPQNLISLFVHNFVLILSDFVYLIQNFFFLFWMTKINKCRNHDMMSLNSFQTPWMTIS